MNLEYVTKIANFVTSCGIFWTVAVIVSLLAVAASYYMIVNDIEFTSEEKELRKELDAREERAREKCHTSKSVAYYGGIPETRVTDSGAISSNAEDLRVLAEHGRFRIIREYARMVVGYWPENDPKKKYNTPEA